MQTERGVLTASMLTAALPDAQQDVKPCIVDDKPTQVAYAVGFGSGCLLRALSS